MTEERSVTFTASDIREALVLWSWYKSVSVPPNAKLTVTEHAEYKPATATLTWRAK
jgi:hypothetical protein